MPDTPETAEVREPLHPLFKLATLSATVFIVTILAMVATVFGDQQAPVAQFLNTYGSMLIVVEVMITLVIVIAAMSADGRRTRRLEQERAFAKLATYVERDDEPRGVAGAGPQGSPGQASRDIDSRFRVERTGASQSLQPRPPTDKP